MDREQLIDAAARVLAANPGASTTHIATGAGVSRATLHRAFNSREALVAAVCDRMLDRTRAAYDDAGVDTAPAPEALARLSESAVALGLAYNVLFVDPDAYGIPRVVEQVEAEDDRLERMFVRGQEDGTIRPELPARWLAYSFSSQTVAAWWAVHEGFVAPRDAPRLVLDTVLRGAVVPGGGPR
jgi:TetR/AcrR family transcriptional regulator, mexCD-oprJ operon repressor